METSCIETVEFKENQWYRIASQLLKHADIQINGQRPWDIQVKHADFFKRVLQQGSLGLGESYMEGWWQCQCLDQLFYRLLRYQIHQQTPKHNRDLIRVLMARLLNQQTRKRALTVGKVHYDLGNDLFSRMLDPYMQYSCGYWHTAETLEQAQQDKLSLICQKLQLKPGMSLLDIGCGWGGLAEYAARHYGVKVYGVTISAEQQKMASQRCKDLDVTILLQDYRDLNQQFDRIVSVGMFEHVGPKNYETYFKVVAHNLKPDGLFLLHTIGANQTSLQVDPWIEKYIFPNGCLPSIAHIARASEHDFVMEDWHNFGADYDKTLMAWFQRFNMIWPTIAKNYDEKFKRMFSYYLNACAGAFRARDIQLWQVVFSRGIEGGLHVPHSSVQ